ncbi:MAG: alpha-amylase family glycosyl hydrolase, partial [Acidimicrobiia bacterium]|nr:alpha-amylase family glycosyl hydrolase [Acidimicrobiia bacterium]
MNDSWDVNYGAGAQQDGPNIALSLPVDADITFYYSPDTHWVTDNHSSVIVTAVGSFQDELGCPGDWQPDCLLTWLQDIDGDGVYTFTTDSIPAGDHEAKAAINESWDINYGQGGEPGGANIPFTSFGRTVTFSFDSATNILIIEAEGLPGIDNNVQWNELGHDSRDGIFRNPGGAVPTGSEVTLRFRAMSGDLEFATMRLWNDRADVETLVPMTKVLDDGEFEWWESALSVGDLPTVYWYRFIAQDGEAIAYYEDDDARLGGWGQTFGDSQDNSWQLTVFNPEFQTPDWVKNAVVYQIFPDRFRDGDSANDTAPGGFFYEERTTEFRSAGTDWNTPICEPRADADTTVGEYLVNCASLYSQNFYGGDLAGIIDKLDYLEELGVTAIYLNPIFESPSNHRYDTTDFLTIEDSLGDLETFIELTEEAHKRGMNVILDGVFNHTSSDSIYFDRYGRYDTMGACESLDSPYRDWYYFSEDGPCAGNTDYTSWFGFDSLPKLNSLNDEVRGLVYGGGPDSIARYWLQWADGWRLDVAGDVDQGVTGSPLNDYWEQFRTAVHATHPDAYIVGEEWGNASSWVLGEEWDATMNYQFSSAVLGFWRDTPFTDNDHNPSSSAGVIDPLAPGTLWDELANLQERYPEEAWLAMMNLLGSHDTNRALFMLDHNAAVGTNDTLLDDPSYDWSDALRRLQGVAILQMTLPGAPTIYYGDEVGLVGPTTYVDGIWQDDPYNRIPYPWLDETGMPFYEHLQSASSQQDIYTHYAALTEARHDHPALRTGALDLLYADEDVLAYGRWIDERRSGPGGANSASDKADAAIVAVNRGTVDQSVVLDLSGYLGARTKLSEVLSGATYRVSDDGSLTVTVPAGSGLVLVPGQQIASRPMAPTLMVTDEMAGEVGLSWTPVGDRISYDVFRSRLTGGGYELVGSTISTVFVDT